MKDVFTALLWIIAMLVLGAALAILAAGPLTAFAGKLNAI